MKISESKSLYFENFKNMNKILPKLNKKKKREETNFNFGKERSNIIAVNINL